MDFRHKVRRAIAGLILLTSFPPSPVQAKTRSASALDSGYIAALTTADHLLQAWQANNIENGMVLLTSHVKDAATADGIERFFSNQSPSAYEIGRGKMLKRGRYEFPIVLVSGAAQNARARRRFSTLVIVDTGHNEWAVDKLP